MSHLEAGLQVIVLSQQGGRVAGRTYSESTMRRVGQRRAGVVMWGRGGGETETRWAYQVRALFPDERDPSFSKGFRRDGTFHRPGSRRSPLWLYPPWHVHWRIVAFHQGPTGVEGGERHWKTQRQGAGGATVALSKPQAQPAILGTCSRLRAPPIPRSPPSRSLLRPPSPASSVPLPSAAFF